MEKLMVIGNGNEKGKYGFDLDCQIIEAISSDDQSQFASLVRGQLMKGESDISKSKLGPSELLVWICHYQAVGCANALLEGKLDHTVDLNVPLKAGLYPLHFAAQSLNPALTKLFLKHGAKANIKYVDIGLRYYGMLPLNVAVEMLSYYIKWTSKESIFKLVISLCLPEMKEPMGAIACLARRTEDIVQVAYHYAKEGKLIELAAMLMVAQEKILYPDLCPFAAEKPDECRFRQSIATEIALLIDEEYTLLGTRSIELLQRCKDKKMLMMSEMLLIEVFERAGSHINEQISGCCPQSLEPVPNVVAKMLEGYGFSLEDEFTQLKTKDCLMDELLPELSEKLAGHTDCRSRAKGLRLPFSWKPSSLFNTKPINRIPTAQQRSMFVTPSCAKLGFSYDVRQFHTSQIFKASNSSELSTTMNAQMKRTTKSIEQHLPSLLPSKQWQFVILAIRRGVRHV